ncbi:hypothetical protein [Cellulomonas terrae]|nr:hypothetical protein [Cellulomonas terrae]
MDAYEPARSAQDWNAVVDAAAELARRTALEVLRTIGVDAPTGASPVALVLLAKEEAPSRNDRFINPEVLPTDRLRDLYRAIWWLRKSLPEVRVSGALAPDAPYNGVRHLVTSLLNDSQKLLVACPQPARPVPSYFQVSPRGDVTEATFPEIDEDIFEEWYTAAHSLVQFDPDAWDPQDAVIEDDAEWDDVILLPDIETDVYSDRFCEAIESVRREGDTHVWLPIGVIRGEERRQYWLPNIFGPAAADTWGLQNELAQDRTVVLPYAGDGDPLFAGRARQAVEDAGVVLNWHAPI